MENCNYKHGKKYIMNYNVKPTPYFLKELKRLSKRYRSLKEDVNLLVASLHENPFQGTDLGKGLHKIRMSITSKGKGKSGGARFITLTLLVTSDKADILLLTLYDKSECENLTDAELKAILAQNGL